ncbi:hypothetical protein CcCBS67573_g09480 [Chytriomyces confervae]|uniref:Uncharacterized protein n=1 Tax=Chytriomyces confervae TaxID=246404 RepID=A0A507DUF5_9FUNG|nr:hypothetical protein HDU80_000249 [Chytriomyces hyalinus]TPX55353.1 hypothetical protein CcCBS67573_g09480 [Chytriomyces confervae]
MLTNDFPRNKRLINVPSQSGRRTRAASHANGQVTEEEASRAIKRNYDAIRGDKKGGERGSIEDGGGEEGESESDSDEFGLVAAMKRTRIGLEDASGPVTRSKRGMKASVSMNSLNSAQSLNSVHAVPSESEDDLDGPTVRRQTGKHLAPVAAANDDASDFCPSDVESSDMLVMAYSRSQAAVLRRHARARDIASRMADHFAREMPFASRAIFAGGPFSVRARLRRVTCDPDPFALVQNPPRWSEKGPVVIMLLPCAEDRPSEARLVAHYTFGTQTAAVNMPISDIHNLYLKRVSPKKVILNSLGNNIIAHAITTQHPRKIRDVLAGAPLNARDVKLLSNAQLRTTDASLESYSNIAIEVAERLEHAILADQIAPPALWKGKRKCAANGSGDSNASGNSKKGGSKDLNRHRQGTGNSSMVCHEEADDSDESSGHNTPVTQSQKEFDRAGSDYLYECQSTVIGVREESSSVFMFVFETSNDCDGFMTRFLQAVNDYSTYRTQARYATFSQPQLIKRALLTGQTVPVPGSIATHVSPFANDTLLACQISETGLFYQPVVSDIPAAASSSASSITNAVSTSRIQHRLICSHCHATLAVCTQTDALPTAYQIFVAHWNHAFAKRGGDKVKGYVVTAAAAAAAVAGVYRCVYASKGMEMIASGNGNMLSSQMADMSVASGGSSGKQGGKKGWDVVVVN